MPQSNYFSKKTIAIVGASGYLGSSLVDILSHHNCSIWRFSRNVNEEKTYRTVKDIVLDINKIDYWDTFVDKIDILFYFGGQTSVYKANDQPYQNYLDNVLPFLNLLESAKKKHRKITIALSSTATVFGLTDTLPVDEFILPKPITIYDIHKLLMENYLEMYCASGFVNGFSIRLPNIYGQGNTLSQASDRGILTKIAQMAFKEHIINIYGNGTYVRDYLHLRDAVQAFIDGVINIDVINGKTYCIGSGIGITIKEAFTKVAELVSLISNMPVKVCFVDMPQGYNSIEERNFISNYNLFNRLTNWKPKITFDDGVRELIDHVFIEFKRGEEV